MPSLATTIHTDMLRNYHRRNRLSRRVYEAIRGVSGARPIYGLEWGDPETVAPLKFVKDTYLAPHLNREHTAVEIGPGGGRWTRYLLGFRTLYVVDYYDALLKELRRSFDRPNMRFIKNNGSDFPGIPDASVDFVFSFGCFVHLDLDIIESYLKNMRRILKPEGQILIQYSDHTKIMSQVNEGFSPNTPEQMRRMVMAAGFGITREDTTTMWNSSIISAVAPRVHDSHREDESDRNQAHRSEQLASTSTIS